MRQIFDSYYFIRITTGFSSWIVIIFGLNHPVRKIHWILSFAYVRWWLNRDIHASADPAIQYFHVEFQKIENPTNLGITQVLNIPWETKYCRKFCWSFKECGESWINFWYAFKVFWTCISKLSESFVLYTPTELIYLSLLKSNFVRL